MAGIALKGVTKRFPGDVVAVDDVTLAIEDGEFMVLVGPSGCGKSTLLRMIAGLEEVSEGAIAIGERDVTTLEPKQRDIAMVFQNYALYPHMTVERNLSFGLRLRRTPKAVRDKRVGDVARTLGLHDLLQRRPSALSGGQRQRVAMGRAMVREPQAFLMDEPLSNLDAKLRVQMRAELARLHARLRTTTVYVTHDQVEAMTLGTRVAVLRSGVLQQVDTPQNLYRRPRNLFVAAFIGSPSMNLVEARIEGGAARFAGYALPLTARPELAALEGRSVVLGLRPAAFEDARLARASGWPTIDATAEVVEDLGDAMHVIFAIDAPPVLTEDVTAAAEDEEAGALVHDEGGPRAVFVARVDAASRVTAGEPVRLAVDPAGLHAFDPDSGDSLLAE